VSTDFVIGKIESLRYVLEEDFYPYTVISIIITDVLQQSNGIHIGDKIDVIVMGGVFPLRGYIERYDMWYRFLDFNESEINAGVVRMDPPKLFDRNIGSSCMFFLLPCNRPNESSFEAILALDQLGENSFLARTNEEEVKYSRLEIEAEIRKLH